MKISVAKPFKLVSFANVNISDAIEMKSFATTGVYLVDPSVGTHWFAQLFSTVVDDATPATATYAVVSF